MSIKFLIFFITFSLQLCYNYVTIMLQLCYIYKSLVKGIALFTYFWYNEGVVEIMFYVEHLKRRVINYESNIRGNIQKNNTRARVNVS